MPYYPFWKITWSCNLNYLIDYYGVKEFKRKVKSECKVVIDNKVIVFLHLKTAMTKSKVACYFLRAESVEDSNKKEFDQAKEQSTETVYIEDNCPKTTKKNTFSEGNACCSREVADNNTEQMSSSKKIKPNPEVLHTENMSSSSKKKVHFEEYNKEEPRSTFKYSDFKWYNEIYPDEDSKSTQEPTDENSKDLFEQKLNEDVSKENIILRIMDGESVASLVLESKRTKNVKMFTIIHENLEKFKSMEQLVLDTERQENQNTPKGARFNLKPIARSLIF